MCVSPADAHSSPRHERLVFRMPVILDREVGVVVMLLEVTV